MRHTFLAVTVKRWLKSVYIYGSYRKIKTGVPLFLDHPVYHQNNIKIHTEHATLQLTGVNVSQLVHCFVRLNCYSTWLGSIPSINNISGPTHVTHTGEFPLNIDWTLATYHQVQHWRQFTDIWQLNNKHMRDIYGGPKTKPPCFVMTASNISKPLSVSVKEFKTTYDEIMNNVSHQVIKLGGTLLDDPLFL